MPEILFGKPTQVYNGYTLDVLKKKFDEYAPVVVSSDITDFTEDEVKVLNLIIDAAKMMDPIFNRQAYRWYDETRAKLAR